MSGQRDGTDWIREASIQYRRRVARRKIGPATTWSNVSGSGVSQSLRLGPVTVNTRGRVTVRTPWRGLYWRGKL